MRQQQSGVYDEEQISQMVADIVRKEPKPQVRTSPVTGAVKTALAIAGKRGLTKCELRMATNLTKGQVDSALAKLKKDAIVKQEVYGIYTLSA